MYSASVVESSTIDYLFSHPTDYSSKQVKHIPACRSSMIHISSLIYIHKSMYVQHYVQTWSCLVAQSVTISSTKIPKNSFYWYIMLLPWFDIQLLKTPTACAMSILVWTIAYIKLPTALTYGTRHVLLIFLCLGTLIHE
jgi:hypothetical protein